MRDGGSTGAAAVLAAPLLLINLTCLLLMVGEPGAPGGSTERPVVTGDGPHDRLALRQVLTTMPREL